MQNENLLKIIKMTFSGAILLVGFYFISRYILEDFEGSGFEWSTILEVLPALILCLFFVYILKKFL